MTAATHASNTLTLARVCQGLLQATLGLCVVAATIAAHAERGSPEGRRAPTLLVAEVRRRRARSASASSHFAAAADAFAFSQVG